MTQLTQDKVSFVIRQSVQYGPRSHAPRRDEGVALFLVVLVTLLIMAGLAFAVSQSVNAKQQTDFALARYQAEEMGKAGVDYAIERVWGGYLDVIGADRPTIVSFLEYLDRLDAPIGAAPLTLLPDGGLTFPGLDSERREVVSLEMLSDLVPGGVRMRVRATSEVGIFPPVAVEQVIEVSGAPLGHADYAIISDNVSCVLCHAQVRSLPLDVNTSPQNFNTFERVRVASLEALLARSGSDAFAANSRVAGTVYSRGANVLKENLSPFSDDELARSTFRGFEFAADSGAITQDQFGTMQDAPLINARRTDEGSLEPFANLYLSYPSDEDEMVDGFLPVDFPVPYPDTNGNRLVEPGEFRDGTLTAQGVLTGGTIYGVPLGTSYALPAESGFPPAGNTDSIQQVYSGNLLLSGTPQDPLMIHDEVAIDGDLVIKGTVRGWGRLSVRGNIYIVGDVTYDDADGAFGTTVDGNRNGLAMIAGGNVLIGDYLTRRAKSREDRPASWRDLFIDTRTESKIVPATADDNGPVKDVGYFAPDVGDPGSVAMSSEGFLEDNMSFASSAMSQFNQRELNAFRAVDGPARVPRFYQLRDGDPVYAYGGHTAEALGYTTSYNNPFLDIVDPNDPAYVVDGVMPSVLSLGPEDGWLGEEHLRRFWFDDEIARADSGQPFEIDAFIYSSNAIIGIARSKDLHNSNTMGQMLIRGALSAPDLGLLVPGADRQTVPREGLTVQYDPRVTEFVLQDPNTIVFRRTVFRYVTADAQDVAS